jgi:hypothetical protein
MFFIEKMVLRTICIKPIFDVGNYCATLTGGTMNTTSG